MRILVWNMAAGFGHNAARHEAAWRFVDEFDPDVALLQEAVVPEWAAERWPSILHARHHFASEDQPGPRWGSAIIAKTPDIEPLVPDAATPWLGALWGAVVAARLPELGGRWVASVHSNAYELKAEMLAKLSTDGLTRCSDTKIWEIEVIAWELARVFGDQPFVMGGDLNSALLFDTNYGRNSNARLFENLRAGGFHDLRLASSDQEQQTFFRVGSAPYQLDHVFGDGETAEQTRTWRVLTHVATELKLSDHAPIEVVVLHPRFGDAIGSIEESWMPRSVVPRPIAGGP